MSALIEWAGKARGAATLAELRLAAVAAAVTICAAGGGGNTVNVSALETPPPPPSVGVETVTGAEAAAATSAEVIAAFNPLVLANVVTRGLPFHRTVEQGARCPLLAPVASTPSRKAADPTGTLEGKSAVIAGAGSGVVEAAIVNGADAEAKRGLLALETVMVAGPGNAVSVAERVAVNCVGLT